MDHSLKRLLLPEGESIDHEGNELEIVRKIGSGFTSEVYEAYLNKDQQRIHVAVKVMREHGISEEIRKFNQEFITLSSIYSIQSKATQFGSSITVPATYGLSKYENRSYFVMDFLTSKNIPDLLAESTEFSELELVVISKQLFQLLHILHTDLKKTYIDLKLENLWYDRDNQQLTMTDFGTLEDLKDFGICRDLLTASIYMFGLYSGYFISASNGVLLENPSQMINNTDLTDGVKALFHRLLHKNINVRPQSAGEIADDMRLFSDTWLRSDEENIQQLNKILQDAKDQLAFDLNQAAERAKDLKAIYSILGRKGNLEKLVFDDSEYQKILSQTDIFARIRHEFKRASYNQARKLAEQFLEQSPNDKQSDMIRRWWFLARIAEKYPKEIKNIEQNLLVFIDPESLGDELSVDHGHLTDTAAWDQVYSLLKEAIPDKNEIDHIFSELQYSKQVSLFFESFARKDYPSAIEHLTRAKEYTSSVSHQESFQSGSLLNHEVIDYFEVIIYELDDQQKRLTSDLDRALALAEKADWQALDALINASYPSSVVNQHHISRIDKIGLIALKQRGFELASRLYGLGKKYASIKRPYTIKLRISKMLRDLYDAQTFIEIEQAYEHLLSSKNLFSMDDGLREIIFQVVDYWLEKSGKQEDYYFVSRYQEFLQTLGEREKANDLEVLVNSLKHKYNRQIEEKSKILFEEATSQFFLDKHELIFHKRSLADALKLLHNRQYRLDECSVRLMFVNHIAPADKTKKECALVLEKVQQERNNNKNLIEKRTVELENAISRELPLIQSAWKEYENLNSMFASISNEDQQVPQVLTENVANQLFEKTNGLLERIVHFLSVYDTSHEEVLGYFNEIIERGETAGGPSWQSFVTTDPGHSIAQLQKLADAKNLYFEGKSIEGLTLINSFVPELSDFKNWLALKNKLNEASTFLAWSAEFSLVDLPQEAINRKLDQTLNYLERSIPLVYWKKSNLPSKISKYYRDTYKKLIQLDMHHTESFVETLQKFLRAELVVQKMPEEIRPQIRSKKRAAGR